MSRAAFLGGLLLLACGSAWAHTPTGPTARVTVRDGHLTVELEVALADLETARAALPDVVARIDGRPAPLAIDPAHSGLPSHRGFARVALASAEPVPADAAVSLTLPAALGPVAVTFVEPRMQYVAGGGTARFVRGATATRPVAWISAALAALALGLVGWLLYRRRSG